MVSYYPSGGASEPSRHSVLERRDFVMRRMLGPIQDSGLGHWEQLELDPELTVWSVNAPAGFQDELCPFEANFIEFQFRFEGTIERRIGPNSIRLTAGSLFIGRQPEQKAVYNKVPGGDRNAHVTIFCTPRYIEQKFGDFRCGLRPHIADALGPAALQPFAMRVPLYPRLTRLAHDLARSHFTTTRRLVQAEGYVLVLIAEILAILEAAQDDSALPRRLSDRDFDKIHLVRERLIRGSFPSPSLKDLAREAGLGSTKLKTGFRALFGQSIFAFTHDLRMCHARDLLRRNDMSIARVAETVGYDYQQSFTVAFERYFGMLPSAYRRNPTALDQVDQQARWVAADNGIDPDRMFGITAVRRDGG
ncbi:hypothetical protein HY78_21840 [Rhizorhabdus wittichii DC-6]|nr:hypothetical protein HY78_21840 [Rhizorhabdus wittichii DC-6]